VHDFVHYHFSVQGHDTAQSVSQLKRNKQYRLDSFEMTCPISWWPWWGGTDGRGKWYAAYDFLFRVIIITMALSHFVFEILM